MPNPSQQGYQPNQQKQPGQPDPYPSKVKPDNKSGDDKEDPNCSTKDEQGFRKDSPDTTRRG